MQLHALTLVARSYALLKHIIWIWTDSHTSTWHYSHETCLLAFPIFCYSSPSKIKPFQKSDSEISCWQLTFHWHSPIFQPRNRPQVHSAAEGQKPWFHPLTLWAKREPQLKERKMVKEEGRVEERGEEGVEEGESQRVEGTVSCTRFNIKQLFSNLSLGKWVRGATKWCEREAFMQWRSEGRA